MDVISLFSGIMIGAGIGLAFCTAIIYTHHREVTMEKGGSDLFEAKPAEDLKDAAQEDFRKTNKARQ